jgi:hypothetical protein
MEIVVLPEEERSAEIRTLGMLPASFPPGWLLWDMILYPDLVFQFTAAQVVFKAAVLRFTPGLGICFNLPVLAGSFFIFRFILSFPLAVHH